MLAVKKKPISKVDFSITKTFFTGDMLCCDECHGNTSNVMHNLALRFCMILRELLDITNMSLPISI